MQASSALETFWLTFPFDPHLPMGIGVTAFSEQDAFALLEEQRVLAQFKPPQQIKVLRGVRIQDLDQQHVVPNMGPMQFRGIWFPYMNIGYGASGPAEYKPLVPDEGKA